MDEQEKCKIDIQNENLFRFKKKEKENPEICENVGNFEDTMLSKINQSQGDKY